jgi:hypothetical protein
MKAPRFAATVPETYPHIVFRSDEDSGGWLSCVSMELWTPSFRAAAWIPLINMKVNLCVAYVCKIRSVVFNPFYKVITPRRHRQVSELRPWGFWGSHSASPHYVPYDIFYQEILDLIKEFLSIGWVIVRSRWEDTPSLLVLDAIGTN